MTRGVRDREKWVAHAAASIWQYVARMGAYERGQATWPTVALERAAFTEHVARLGAGDEHAEDLYLACACAAGDAAAIAIFDAHIVAAVPRWIARIDASPAVADEACQRVRDYLLVGKDGARPHIADYAGRGPLAGWVRVVASRTVLEIKRRAQRDPVDSDANAAERLASCEPNPEVALIRRRHGRELADALREAIAALSERERGLIKLAVIDELTIDELAALYGVHRATVARWVARLKEETLDAAVAILRRRLALDTAAVESLCRAVRSQLDLSLGGLIDA